MTEVTKYMCDTCGELFSDSQDCIKHEQRHRDIKEANEMLKAGKTIADIQAACNIWPNGIPKHTEKITKDSCFVIKHWECCRKPAYRIVAIHFDGRLQVEGKCTNSGVYGNVISIDNTNLTDPRPADELYVCRNKECI